MRKAVCVTVLVAATLTLTACNGEDKPEHKESTYTISPEESAKYDAMVKKDRQTDEFDLEMAAQFSGPWGGTITQYWDIDENLREVIRSTGFLACKELRAGKSEEEVTAIVEKRLIDGLVERSYPDNGSIVFDAATATICPEFD
jgi:hypothetical protein